MSLLIKLLLAFFAVLLFYQLFIKNGYSYKEGLEKQYKDYDQNDALVLSKQNAGNIEVLRGQLNEMSGFKQQFADLSSNVSSLEEKVLGLMEQQEQMATDLTGGTAPEVSGATEEDNVDETMEDTTEVETFANYRRDYLL